jgi:hypothetical protein
MQSFNAQDPRLDAVITLGDLIEGISSVHAFLYL